MFEKILVATDASEYSCRALKLALELGRKFQAEVELLFVTYIPDVSGNYNFAYNFVVSPEQIEEAGELALEATLKGVDVSGVSLKTKKRQGYPANAILQEIEEENIDLVVMGSHGYGPIMGSVLGSVSQRVLQRAECPVLIVK